MTILLMVDRNELLIKLFEPQRIRVWIFRRLHQFNVDPVAFLGSEVLVDFLLYLDVWVNNTTQDEFPQLISVINDLYNIKKYVRTLLRTSNRILFKSAGPAAMTRSEIQEC